MLLSNSSEIYSQASACCYIHCNIRQTNFLSIRHSARFQLVLVKRIILKVGQLIKSKNSFVVVCLCEQLDCGVFIVDNNAQLHGKRIVSKCPQKSPSCVVVGTPLSGSITQPFSVRAR